MTRDQQEWPPVFDEREAFAVPPRVPDPVVQRRTKNNKRRGRAAERAWAALIALEMKHGGLDKPQPLVLGGLGHVDVLWDWGQGYAFEVKQSRGDWPSSTIVRKAQEQAQKNAHGGRLPVVVGCATYPGGVRQWRVYLDCVVEGREWVKGLLR